MTDEQANSDSNYENSNPNSNETDEPVYVMTLELEKGRAEQIKIYADSDANELAYAFCKEHDLDFSALEYLKERIDSLLGKIRERTESQGSQIEEVDDEHSNTEDNKYSEIENKNHKEYITDENGQESEKEMSQKQKEANCKRHKDHKPTNEGIGGEHKAVLLEKADKERVEMNLRPQIESGHKEFDSNVNNEDEDLEEREKKEDNSFEDNKGSPPIMKKEHIGSDINNDAVDNIDQGNEDAHEEEEEEKQVPDQTNESPQMNDNKGKEDNNTIDHELFNEDYNTAKNPKKEKSNLLIDPFYDQLNQEQIELDNDIDPNSSLGNEENNNINNGALIDAIGNASKKEVTIVNAKSKLQPNKTPLFQAAKTQEQSKPYLIKNEKGQAPSVTLAPLSSTQQNETKSHKNYFRTTNPIFNQNIQSTLNTKPQTQTEQKSTSHSPPQSNTTNPTLNNNNYTIKPLIRTPPNQKESHQVPLTNSASEKRKENGEEDEDNDNSNAEARVNADNPDIEEKKKKDIPNDANFRRYYSYCSQKQMNINQNIFDRLFRDAEIKRILPYHQCYNPIPHQEKKATAAYNAIKTKQDPDKFANMNYGEYLYSKDKMMKEEKEKQISQIKEFQSQQEIYSFKPSIASEYNTNKLPSNLSNPSITRVDKMERVKKELNEVCTFKPKINRNYNTELSFNDRQDFFSNLYKQRSHELNQIINSKQDEKGNLLFHPQLVSKQTEPQVAEANVNRFDKNYNYAIQYRKNKEELSHKIYEEKKKTAAAAYRNNHTDKIIVSLHKEAFGNLFKELNRNQDGQLTPFNLTTKKTPKNILAIISPLICELKEDNQTLSESEFVSAIEQLFKEISVIEQRMLINAYRKQRRPSKSKGMMSNEKCNNSYKPLINSNTSKLALRYDTKIAERYPEIIGQKKRIVNRGNFFKSESKRALEAIQTFTNIHNYTFDNYVKKLN